MGVKLRFSFRLKDTVRRGQIERNYQ